MRGTADKYPCKCTFTLTKVDLGAQPWIYLQYATQLPNQLRMSASSELTISRSALVAGPIDLPVVCLRIELHHGPTVKDPAPGIGSVVVPRIAKWGSKLLIKYTINPML